MVPFLNAQSQDEPKKEFLGVQKVSAETSSILNAYIAISGPAKEDCRHDIKLRMLFQTDYALMLETDLTERPDLSPNSSCKQTSTSGGLTLHKGEFIPDQGSVRFVVDGKDYGEFRTSDNPPNMDFIPKKK